MESELEEESSEALTVRPWSVSAVRVWGAGTARFEEEPGWGSLVARSPRHHVTSAGWQMRFWAWKQGKRSSVRTRAKACALHVASGAPKRRRVLGPGTSSVFGARTPPAARGNLFAREPQ